jgi:hypothetical protein
MNARVQATALIVRACRLQAVIADALWWSGREQLARSKTDETTRRLDLCKAKIVATLPSRPDAIWQSMPLPNCRTSEQSTIDASRAFSAAPAVP